MKKYDVIIVGAGPAGSTAARFCAKAGLSTLLLEKASLPRTKICAGGLIPLALKYGEISLPEDLIEHRCNKIAIHYRKKETILEFKKPIAYMIERKNFDYFLVESASNAGAKIHEEEPFNHFEYEGSGIHVFTSRDDYFTKLLVGADGYASRVRKSADIKFDMSNRKVCIESEIPISRDIIKKIFNETIHIHYGLVPKGYGWVFPKHDQLSVGVGGDLNSARFLKNALQKLLVYHGLPQEVKSRGWFLPPTNIFTPVIGKGIILTGDAAGFVDAFSGEGIRFAIMSGKLAAKTVIDCFYKKDLSHNCLTHYWDACSEAFFTDLSYSIKLSERVFLHSNIVIPAVMKNRRLLTKYVQALTGEIQYTTLVQWLKARLPFILLNRFFPTW